MSLDDEIKKYCNIILRHENNPCLKEIVEKNSTFVSSLCSFYDLNIRLFSNGKIDWGNCIVKSQDNDKLGKSLFSLSSILMDFTENQSEAEIFRNKNLEEGLKYEFVRKNFKIKRDAEFYADGISNTPLFAVITAPFVGAFCDKLPIVGFPMLSVMTIGYSALYYNAYKAIRLNYKTFKAGRVSWEKTAFEVVSCCAYRADKYLDYYKNYSLLKELETEKK
jgi:hypothetical protein